MLGELEKFRPRDFSPGGDQHTISARYRRRQLTFRENWSGARLPADLSCEFVGLSGDQQSARVA